MNPTPTPKPAHSGPKHKNDPKIKSKSNVRIQGIIENKSWSTIWVHPKIVFDLINSRVNFQNVFEVLDCVKKFCFWSEFNSISYLLVQVSGWVVWRLVGWLFIWSSIMFLSNLHFLTFAQKGSFHAVNFFLDRPTNHPTHWQTY